MFWKILDIIVDTLLLSSKDARYRDISISNNIKYKK